MGIQNALILSSTSVAMSETSSSFEIENYAKGSFTAKITGSNPSNVTFDTGTMEVQTITVLAKASCTAGDYIRFYDSSGTAWAFSLNKSGADPEPTGAIWVSIAASKKVHVDISSATTAAQVMALVETAVDGLTGLSAVITTDDSAADGSMTFTQIVPGPTTDPTPKNADDSGAGTITGVQTTAGVATEVDPSANTVTIPSHGLLNGVKITELTTTTTLPAGLSTSTVYYAIVVDANTIKFATSQANALAGTAVDITGYGVSGGVHTLSIATALAGSIKLQVDVEPASGTANWVDISDDEILNGNASQTYSGEGSIRWVIPEILFRAVRAVVTATSGTVLVEVRAYLKAIRS